MIIPQENLATYISEKDEVMTTTKYHKPSNVFFQAVKKKGTYEFVGFLVARFDSATNTVVEEQKFNGKKDTSFFKAVDYFEELIEKNSPKEEQNKQDDFDSVGLFVYFKGGQEEPFIKIEDTITEIAYQDVDKVFTPPQTKKFGRLDMTVLDDPKYDVVRSKFALKYTEEISKEIAKSKGMSVEDVWAYEMQPYSNGTDDQDDSQTPPDVNDKSLNANDIEGEEPQQREPNPQEKQQQQENNENQPQQDGGDEGEDEDLGWDEDKNSESDSQSTEESTEENPDENTHKPPSDEESDENAENGNSQSDFQSTEETTEENSDTHQPLGVYNMDLIEALNKSFRTDDILSSYKNPKIFMSALKLQGENVKQFAPYVGLDSTATKQEVLNKIEEQITPFYQ